MAHAGNLLGSRRVYIVSRRRREGGGPIKAPTESSREEFAQAARTQVGAMYRAARAVLDSDADAEDAVGEALLKAWQSWDRLKDPAAVRAWLLRITVNCAYNQQRKLGRVTMMEDIEPLTGSTQDRPYEDLWEAVSALSSLGFDEDGQLHVQFELLGETRLYNQYSLSYWDSTRIEEQLTGRETWVMFENGKYVDVCFHDIGPALAGRFRANEWDAVLHTVSPIKGIWKLEFEVPLMGEVRQVESPAGNKFSGIQVDKMTFSVSGFRFDWRQLDPESRVWPCWQPTIYLSNGATAQPNTVKAEGSRLWQWPDGTVIGDAAWGADNGGNAVWYGGELYFPYEEAIDPSQVVGAAIGQWYIPLEGNAAQPGCWLAELPKAE